MKLRLFILFELMFVTACGSINLTGKERAETKDRLSPERIERLVRSPMRLVNEGHLSEGEAEFQRVLEDARRQHGPGSVEVADLYSSFGVKLFFEGSDESREASRKYLEQAIPAYRTAFGQNHPEVAVALNDLASIEKILAPDDPPARVESLLREALRIRTQKLGPTNPETRATMTYLANVYSLPAWLERNPKHFDHADTLYRSAMVNAATGPKGDSVTNGASIRVRLAKLYARTGHQPEALELVGQSLAMSHNWPAKVRCDLVEKQLDDVVEIMAENGAAAATKAIKPVGEESACFRLTQPPWFERFLRALGLRQVPAVD
jgi:tetratricopeptide (TPR) repeat protein